MLVKYPVINRTTKNRLAPNVSSAKAETPCLGLGRTEPASRCPLAEGASQWTGLQCAGESTARGVHNGNSDLSEEHAYSLQCNLRLKNCILKNHSNFQKLALSCLS